ncbi:YegS/Rv2252/BmrU family lipid kinase [Clostridium botulinum C]|uniref:YegS/Rv2252/BmrU family lipid kinase n=3 Tax=Clostridium botulinum TaxID=1491 RepID=A0A9Q4XSR9_CLOBO|nr:MULTISPECIES: YegS/Rv2252/BmrU family lipid kinase [Clostridium]EGO88196.1 lipid kinase [Clostridium botulinum C str. Stockholm]AYF53539.1 lipid kinase [Clostridium novyi]EES91625.1 putative lipid kinase [Clostridium botulinum D str. 1873]KEI07658.1 lipid kinase [Clostridium sp. K25]MBO3440892.1 YegS/Rv2252/BmrU family lipid kinase [Clostridium haemolyticum]
MNKVKFIYNPYSGENAIIAEIDNVIMIHQKYGYIVEPFRISKESNLKDALKNIDDSFKYILVAGGDGTVDSLVNCMKSLKIDLPIGILPVGTANDFAKAIGISRNIKKACEQILNSEPIPLDLGKINDKYFINVASTGLFTDVSQKTDVNLKNTIGKLAYYVKGIEQIPSFRKLKIKVTSDHMEFDDNMYLMLVFNGKTAGNFHLAYKADLTDGLLDVIIVKAGMIKDIIGLFIKILKGEHLEGIRGITYFKTDKLTIECYEDIVTDIDGERGPDFPVTIRCIKGGIKVLGVKR